MPFCNTLLFLTRPSDRVLIRFHVLEDFEWLRLKGASLNPAAWSLWSDLASPKLRRTCTGDCCALRRTLEVENILPLVLWLLSVCVVKEMLREHFRSSSVLAAACHVTLWSYFGSLLVSLSFLWNDAIPPSFLSSGNTLCNWYYPWTYLEVFVNVTISQLVFCRSTLHLAGLYSATTILSARHFLKRIPKAAVKLHSTSMKQK